MILIVAAAVLGAGLGLFMRSRMLALAVAISLAGAIHLILAFGARLIAERPNQEKLLHALDMVTFTGVHGVWPVMAAAGTGTLIAALAWSVTQRQGTDGFWFPESSDRRNGVKSMYGVEERAVHAEAREWLDDVLKR